MSKYVKYMGLTAWDAPQPTYVSLLSTGRLSVSEDLGHCSHAGPVQIGNFIPLNDFAGYADFPLSF